jgi:hypothetical protein
METIRDRLWLWGHEAGCHNEHWMLPGASRMTPVEAAFYMGTPNLIMVVYGNRPAPPFFQYALPMRPLKRLVWSIVGDSSSKRNDESSDLNEVLALAAWQPNLCGAIMDDFFHPPDENGRVARYSPEELAGFARRLHAADRPLDLWVVVYAHQLDIPMAAHLEQCDVLTLWTWKAPDLARLEENFDKLEAIAPRKRKVLGCYMWDYGQRMPMPLEAMQHQCELGLRWLKAGRIEGMIFLASCICDLQLEAVEWTRQWIAKAGEQRF